MNEQERNKERWIALVTATVLLLTVVGALLSFAQASNAVVADLRDGVDFAIFCIVVVNVILSVFVFFYARAKLTNMEPKKAYMYGAGTSLSATWDVVALVLALIAFASPGIYVYLGIVLLVDAIIDIVVHFKR